MGKKMCSITKGGVKKDDRKAFAKIVANPTHFCTKCGHVASDKKRLCKPEPLTEK